MRILCLGDSNTYGYDPRGFGGGRYPADSRWPELLALQTHWDLVNLGENGLEIPRGFFRIPEDGDWILVMLGTNDLLQGADADTAAFRMEGFLQQLLQDEKKPFLIAPPPLKPGAWVPPGSLIAQSAALGSCYRAVASRLGIPFADSSQWNISLAYDGVHFTEQGHRDFARSLAHVLQKGR